MSARAPGEPGVGGARGTHAAGGKVDAVGDVCVGVVTSLLNGALGMLGVFALAFLGEIIPGVLFDSDSRGVLGVAGSCSGALLEK